MEPALKAALVLVWANLSVWSLGLIIAVFSGWFGMVHRATEVLSHLLGPLKSAVNY